MLKNVTQLACVLQVLLTSRADEVAHAVGLVQRRRVLSGGQWVQTLVFGWLQQPRASLEELADGAERLQAALSPQALDRWFCPQGVCCLKELIAEAVGQVLQTEAAAVPLLQRFTSVSLEDCTTIALPACLADEYPGCGGNDDDAGGGGQAALKIYVRQDVRGGTVTAVSFQPGREPDVKAGQQAAPLPAGSLRLKDLGFFDTQLLARDREAGVHWISRLPSSVCVQATADGPTEGLDAFLRRQTGDALDQSVWVGTATPVQGRLVAVRCPEAVRERRLRALAAKARKKGRPVSDRQRELCGWTVLLTDLDGDGLGFDELWVLYRVRWQIELLFKLWKGTGGLDKSQGRRGDRVLCEVLAKLLGQLVQHWLLLTAGPWLDGRSTPRKVRVLRLYLQELVAALGCVEALVEVLQKIAQRLQRLRRRSRRRKKPLTLDLLKEPWRARLN